jgi:diguanylate cyclase (GGDEF)-like protein
VSGSGTVRWRLWVAMLALALVPTIGGAYLVSSLFEEPAAAPSAAWVRETSESAAHLLARVEAVEARLLQAAGDPAIASLANGVRGDAEKRVADRLLEDLRAGDGAIVTGACIVRSSDGKVVPLAGGPNGQGAPCLSDVVLSLAVGATDGGVTRASSGSNGIDSLVITTALRSVPQRSGGFLSAEVDVAALFDRTRLADGAAVSSMLVDMGSSEAAAALPVGSGPVDGAGSADPAALAAGLPGTAGSELSQAGSVSTGLVPTVVPLWTNGDGTSTGLVQLWSQKAASMPFEVRLALLLMLVAATGAVIILVRYIMRPVKEMAESRAELQVLYKEAREDAVNDGLTGLGNHRAFQEELARQFTIFEQVGRPFALAFMDLDDLKVVNDRDGHAAGDELLASMAQTMRDLARDEDLLYRTGGDEFAMILPRTEIGEAESVVERILHFAKRPTGGARPSAFSSGISGVPHFTRQRDMLCRQADAALYWAKRHGRGTVEVFDSERDRLPDEFGDAIGNAVTEVINGKLLRPVFQPIVDLRTGHVLGFEGLIRPDPNGPLPDTSRLFAAAAASGRTVELDLACIEAVVNAARAIGPDRLLTLNLSPRTLEVKDFDAAWLLSGLVRNGISPSRVIIELTEREEIDDLYRLQDTFTHLQQYGLRLAADDVGAGNAGLRLLSQVQFDIVKIDLSLVQDGVRRLGSRTVLESLRDLAISQKARVVAEGVETSKQLQVIRELDIGAGQGYLLGRPDASVEMTYVDVGRLASGLLIPATVAPLPLPVGPILEEDVDDISFERRAVFLPPAGRTYRAEPA